MNTGTETGIQTDNAPEFSVYDSKNWMYSGIHDRHFEGRLHELELSIRSQHQQFSEVDLYLLLSLFNFSESQKGANVKEIDNIDEFHNYFKYLVNEVLQAESRKTEHFMNEMQKMQTKEFFLNALSDLVINRLIYCDFLIYRTDADKKIVDLRLFENTSSTLVYLIMELQKYYRGMLDSYQKQFPLLENDIRLNADQKELLDEYVIEVLVGDDLNKTRMFELFQEENKIYRLRFPDNSFFYVHPQGLLDLPGIVQRKLFEVYKYYYLRRTMDSFTKDLMEGIIKEINKLKKGDKEYTNDEVYRIFQEEKLDEESLLPWYYWSFVMSEKLSIQKKVKDSMKKYYQSAKLLKSYLHKRAEHLEETGEDLVEKEEVAEKAAPEPISMSEQLADINQLMRKMHENPEFYTVDGIYHLGDTIGLRDKYNAPQADGYNRFIETFVEKVSNMVSQKTNMKYVTEIPVMTSIDEKKYFVYSLDLAVAFLYRCVGVAKSLGMYYAEIFAQPSQPFEDKKGFARHVEQTAAEKEPLFYKLYSQYMKEIFVLLNKAKLIDKINVFFYNQKADAPRPIVEILNLDYDYLKSVGEKLDEQRKEKALKDESQITEKEIKSMPVSAPDNPDPEEEVSSQMPGSGEEQTDSPPSHLDDVKKAMKQVRTKETKKFKFLEWFFGLIAKMFEKLRSAGKKTARSLPKAKKSGSEKKAWRQNLTKSFNKMMDKDLQNKKNRANNMKNLLSGGAVRSKGPKAGSGKNNALTTREILDTIAANVLDSCGLSRVPLDDAMNRLEAEWNNPMVIGKGDVIEAEKQRLKVLVKKKVNEMLRNTRFSLSPSGGEAEILGKAKEISRYQDFASVLKTDELKVYLEWYIALYIVDHLEKEL